MDFSVVEKKYHQVKERKKGKSLEILDLVKEVRLSLKKKCLCLNLSLLLHFYVMLWK